MARTLQRVLFGFLSTAVFFAAFVVVGDVLMAALAAVIVAVVQFVLARTATGNPGVSILASLALVLALTGLSLAGDDTFPTRDATQVNATQPDSHCRAPNAANPARATPVPFREAPKVVVPAGGRA